MGTVKEIRRRVVVRGIKMNKIGILTFWGVPNYGAWAQSYALNKIVKGIVKEKYEVAHINYLCQIHNDLYYLDNIRLKNSFDYSWREIPHTNQMNGDEISKEYFDILITGSDSIWEFSLPEMGDDVHLIGNSLNSPRIISYAASFGITSLKNTLPDYIRDGLKNYEAISVRDDNSQEVVYSLMDQKVLAPIHLDPVLLWDFKNDQHVKDCIYTSYIAVYGTKWSREFIDYAKMFAKEKNLILISIGDNNTWCDVCMRMIELRCHEWIGMIKNAEYVFTSTYHGLLFSIALDKQFKFDMVPYVRNRAITILNNIGVDSYYGDGKTLEEVFDTTLKYNTINKKLNKLRKESIGWLSNAIKGDI